MTAAGDAFDGTLILDVIHEPGGSHRIRRNASKSSFDTKAQAPAAEAACRTPGSSKLVMIKTFVSGKADLKRRVALMPSIPTIRTSIKTQSGRHTRQASSASAPSPASNVSSTRSSTRLLIARRICWLSSTIKTFTRLPQPPPWH
jgi:hypothetical protein